VPPPIIVAPPGPPAPPGSPVPDRDADTIPDARDNCIDRPNPGQADRDSDAIGDACDSSDASVGPTLGRTVIARVVSGDVFVRLPGASGPRGAVRAAQVPQGYVPLKGAQVLPVGTIVHATRGRLALTSAAGRRNGRTQTQRAEFYAGTSRSARSAHAGRSPTSRCAARTSRASAARGGRAPGGSPRDRAPSGSCRASGATAGDAFAPGVVRAPRPCAARSG